MKRIIISALSCFLLNPLAAQYKLSGSTYSQNFNMLSSGVPAGWDITANATDTSIGSSEAAALIATPGTTTRWGNVSGAFKNVASANGFSNFAAGTSALQLAATDRALGVKQTGTFGDAGAAFIFCIDNTFGLSDFEMDLKIQSLDSSAGSRITPWQIQYAFGDSPKTFSTLSAFVTGGNKFENLPQTISFGSYLNDKREKVWIRIFAVKASTGAGSRTTTAIDDVELRWTGTAIPSFRPLAQKFYPANAATDVALGSALSIQFSKNINLGSVGDIRIKNETDNATQIISATSSFLKVSGKQLLISGVRLDPSKSYHVTFDSSIVDTALATTFSLTDTTEWRFSTSSSLPNFVAEYFDTACAKTNSLPDGWSTFNTKGTEVWNCFEHVSGNSSARIYGNDGATNVANEDWLISPRIDMRSPDALGISFRMFKLHSGSEIQMLASNNYAGSGSPDSASWASLPLTINPADVNKWMNYLVPVASHKSQPLYVAFKYSSSSTAAYDIRIDSFMTMIKTGLKNVDDGISILRVIDQPESNGILLQASFFTPGNYLMELYNSFGQKVETQSISITSSAQLLSMNGINFLPGMYIVKLKNESGQWLQKCVVK